MLIAHVLSSRCIQREANGSSYLPSPLWSIHVPLLLVATRWGLSLPLLHGALLVCPLCVRGLQEYGLSGLCPSRSSPGQLQALLFLLGLSISSEGLCQCSEGPWVGWGSLLAAGSPTAARWGQRWEQQPCLSLRTQASTDVRAGTGLGRPGDTQLAGGAVAVYEYIGWWVARGQEGTLGGGN